MGVVDKSVTARRLGSPGSANARPPLVNCSPNPRHVLTYRPLTHRALQWLADNLSLPPVAVGIVCTTTLGLLALWFSWLIGIVDEVAGGRLPDIALRAPVTLYMMMGYLPVALYYLMHWTTGHFDELVREFALDHEPVLFPRSSANWIGAAGSLTMCLLFLDMPNNPLLLLTPWHWPAGFTFPFVGLVFLGWFNFRFMLVFFESMLAPVLFFIFRYRCLINLLWIWGRFRLSFLFNFPLQYRARRHSGAKWATLDLEQHFPGN